MRRMRLWPGVDRKRWGGLVLALLAAGCHPSKKSNPPPVDVDAGPPLDAGPPFEAVSARSAVTKVKDLLLGLPPTDAEVASVAADPNALKGLVTGWVAQPEYTAKMQTFFATAFQQSQALSTDFAQNGTVPSAMVPNLNESFARTVIQLLSEGRPFTDVFTTTRFMLTPALMVQYAFLDESPINDKNQASDTILKATDGGFRFTLEYRDGGIPLDETLNPSSPNYMVWADPTLTTSYDPKCPVSPIFYTTQ